MRFGWAIARLLSVLCLLFLVTLSYAKTPEIKFTPGKGPVDVEADELIYEREAQLIQAHGRVIVTRGNFSLKADHALVNRATEEVEAWGNVVLREGEDVLECERLEVNLTSQAGKVYQAKLFLKDQNFHITGREGEKLGENRYRIRDGSFTTCDATRPPWKFTVTELEVTLNGYGIVKNPIFYIENVPVLYLPVAVFPVQKERQTGFLLPEVSYSGRFGPETKTAFFWAMTKDMDATFYLDWWGKRGFKEGLEYRYAFTRETQGQANFYFIDDQDFGGNRYAVFAHHEQKFPDDFYVKGDANYVSDNRYTIDFDEDLPMKTKIDSRSTRQLRSVLFGGKNWDQFSLLADTRFFKDLTLESNDETVQKLPGVSFNIHPQSLLRTPLFLDLDSSYAHFWREKGIEAHRWDLFPRMTYPLRLFNVVKIEPNLGGRETLYRPYNDPAGMLNEWKSRETFETGVEMATELYRVYEGTDFPRVSNLFKVAKWMHTIEPKIGYRFIPRIDQDDLPLFDEVDRIPFTSQITYGFTQRLVGKPVKGGTEAGPYEYAKLNIFQSYSLGDPFSRDSKGKGRFFSDIQGELWWYFKPYITAQLDAAFNPYEGNLNGINSSIILRDRRKDAFLVSYRYTKDFSQGLNVYGRVKTIEPLYFYGAVLYNFLDDTRVESIYGAEYQSQCWTLGLNIEDKGASPDGTQRREFKFNVYLNLLGLGSVGRRSSIPTF
jgi:LPS-assembly protein